ncbi:hypothetical protein [Paenibacillus sp. JJ-223]|uniref:hypothetical protein n=1 Tax=Paenibacillus sp. JJ-223 TaxID=2905647 RepID=UPI001F2E0F54|nr:hypothetical protein [Paenibacillus sp. JJ-223]CAH1220549.1 hypothetical protein PAECIP111890_05078 [Paenibacillus sp. JJ-223]
MNLASKDGNNSPKAEVIGEYGTTLCLNDDAGWLDFMANYAKRQTTGWFDDV